MGARGAAAVGALIAALGDEDDEVRRQAARALGQMGPAAKEAVPHLVAALKEPARGGSEDRQGP
jgi:HEAT repeat protein